MISINTPERYLNEAGALRSAGELIAPLGRNALVIGGKTALAVAGPVLLPSLSGAGIEFEVRQFGGYCTQSSIDSFAVVAGNRRADLIIGVGGGRVLDLAKAVAEKVQIPVVTVPTIAATCAAWSALSIIYNDSDNYISGQLLKQSPKLILVDSGIIAGAPVRYLAAGIGDTLVKWYEAPLGSPGQSNIPSGTSQQIARLALDALQKDWRPAVKSAQKQSVTQDLIEAIDCIIMLAGLVGSIRAGGYRAGLAHPLHNSLTYSPEAHGALHGEKVAFGLLVQFILEGKPQQEITELVGAFLIAWACL